VRNVLQKVSKCNADVIILKILMLKIINNVSAPLHKIFKVLEIGEKYEAKLFD